MAAFEGNPFNFTWQQTMLRIKNPAVTVPFYVDHFGFTLIHKCVRLTIILHFTVK